MCKGSSRPAAENMVRVETAVKVALSISGDGSGVDTYLVESRRAISLVLRASSGERRQV